MRNLRTQLRSRQSYIPGIQVLGLILFLTLLLGGCAGVGVGDIGDIISAGEAIKNVSDANKSFHTNPSEQEYFIGRAVGATIAGNYPTYDDRAANEYLNLLGQTLAKASDRPETFGGYHFQLLDSEEINAFAAPGGLIFVTIGMLRCVEHEDALAAVLAHEIGHVQHEHGMQAIKKSRMSSALTAAGLEALSYMIDSDIMNLVDIFQDSIADITTTMINNGYSRAFEREADRAAITIMQRVGYDTNALVEMLRVMEIRLNPEGKDFAKTHPSPLNRIKDIQKIIGEYQTVTISPAKQQRFEAALGNIK